jgi:hypothetical protein
MPPEPSAAVSDELHPRDTPRGANHVESKDSGIEDDIVELRSDKTQQVNIL